MFDLLFVVILPWGNSLTLMSVNIICIQVYIFIFFKKNYTYIYFLFFTKKIRECTQHNNNKALSNTKTK